VDLIAYPIVPKSQRARRLAFKEWDDLKSLTHENCNWACSYCGYRFSYGDQPACDHKIPLARGGTNDADNLASACRRCNSKKGILTDAEFIATLTEADMVVY
jgi:5-methylcytosine-specific restriction endonuclease McrA